jgi:hypothetical protein
LQRTLAAQLLTELPRYLIGQDRTEVLWWLYGTARDEKRFLPLRQKVTELDDALRANNTAAVAKLSTEIMALNAQALPQTEELWTHDNKIVVILRTDQLRHRDLSTLYAIFPELRPD